MLDLKFVRSNLDSIREMLKTRGYDLDISRFEALDKERRTRLTVLEELRHRRYRCLLTWIRPLGRKNVQHFILAAITHLIRHDSPCSRHAR